jgi:hypothetical protein
MSGEFTAGRERRACAEGVHRRACQAWKLLAFAIFFCLVNPHALGRGADGLFISITETRTEHSRDSNTISRTIRVEGRALVYEETSRRRKPLRKQYQLTDAEVGRLKRLIAEKKLPPSYTVEHPEGEGPHTTIELSVELKSGGKRSALKISGTERSKELEGDRVYQGAKALEEEITDLINSRDESKPR